MLNMSQVDVDKNLAPTFGTCCAPCSRDLIARLNRTERTPMVWGESTCCMSGIRRQVFSERIQELMLTIRLKTLFRRHAWPHAAEFLIRY